MEGSEKNCKKKTGRAKNKMKTRLGVIRSNNKMGAAPQSLLGKLFGEKLACHSEFRKEFKFCEWLLLQFKEFQENEIDFGKDVHADDPNRYKLFQVV